MRGLENASLVAIREGRILFVGNEDDLESVRGPNTRVIDCERGSLLPGFIDAHMHLFAFAANLLALDCSPRAVSSIADIQSALRSQAAATPVGSWIRAWGMEEFHLKEQRVPTRWDLDAAAPRHPVRIVHRSGHASVLNTAAITALGISNETPEPEGALMDRDLISGELTGYFLEMEDDLSRRAAALSGGVNISEALSLAFRRLSEAGITSIHETTPNSTMSEFDLLQDRKRGEGLPLRIYKMLGHECLSELKHRNLSYRSGDDFLRIGAIKLMLNEAGDHVLPPIDDLQRQTLEAHQAGFQVAFHAVEEGGITAGLLATKHALRHGIGARDPQHALEHRHRLEHCGVCPPALARQVASVGMAVATQPGFILEHGERYLSQVPANRIEWLYPVASLRRAGVVVAFGSDSPVAPPRPLEAICAAVTRRSRAGSIVSGGQAIAVREAIDLHTRAGAFLEFSEQFKGAVEPGFLADLVVLSGDPLTVEPEELTTIQVRRTIVGGRTVWER